MRMATRSDSDFLLRTPPYCPTVECFMHRDQEHHVEGCPMYETIGSAFHRLNDDWDAAWDQVRAELERSRRGRVGLIYAATVFHWKTRLLRLRRRLRRS